jgi:hypothetical protein
VAARIPGGKATYAITADGPVAECLRRKPCKVFQPGSIPGRASNIRHGAQRAERRIHDQKGTAVANFTIKGDGDDVAAQLKAKLEADDAQFNAQLNAIFGTAPEPKSPPKPAAISPGPSINGWGDMTSRQKPGGGSMRSRLRAPSQTRRP